MNANIAHAYHVTGSTHVNHACWVYTQRRPARPYNITDLQSISVFQEHTS